MKKQLSISFLIIIIVLFYSCKKDEYSGGDSYSPIDESLYSQIFEEGSYWNYINPETEVVDHKELIEVIHEDRSVGGGHGSSVTAETYTFIYQSSEHGEYDELGMGYVLRENGIEGGFLYFGSKVIGASALNARIVDVHNNYKLLGNEYENVVEFFIESKYGILNPMTLFYADSIGLVKKIEYLETNDTVSWNLQNYNVSLLPIER